MSKGYEVHNLDISNSSNSLKYHCCNVENLNELSKIKNNYDVIVHCAGSPSVPLSVKNPLKDFSINMKGTLNILEYSDNNSKLILLSTVSVI